MADRRRARSAMAAKVAVKSHGDADLASHFAFRQFRWPAPSDRARGCRLPTQRGFVVEQRRVV